MLTTISNKSVFYHLNCSQWLKCQTNKQIKLKLQCEKSLLYSNITLVLTRTNWKLRQKKPHIYTNTIHLCWFYIDLMLSLPLSSSLIYNLWWIFCDFRTQMWRSFCLPFFKCKNHKQTQNTTQFEMLKQKRKLSLE